MSVALIDIADWIEQLTNDGVELKHGGIDRLELIEKALGLNLELERHSDAQLGDAFDTVIDEGTPDIELFGYTISASEVMKQCRQQAYRQLLLDYADQHYVEHGEWHYYIDDVAYRSDCMVEDIRTAFEDAVLAQFDTNSSQYELLDGLTGQREFFQTFKSIWQRRDIIKVVSGKGTNSQPLRLM